MKSVLTVLMILSASFAVNAQSETEMADSGYEVVLMSLSDSANVEPMLKKFEALGYEVEYHNVTVNDTIFTRLTMGGFENFPTAEASAMQLKDELGYDSIWVNKP